MKVRNALTFKLDNFLVQFNIAQTATKQANTAKKLIEWNVLFLLLAPSGTSLEFIVGLFRAGLQCKSKQFC